MSRQVPPGPRQETTAIASLKQHAGAIPRKLLDATARRKVVELCSTFTMATVPIDILYIYSFPLVIYKLYKLFDFD